MLHATLGSRDLFPQLEARAYLNHASVAPPSVPVQAAVGAWLETYARLGVGAFVPASEQRSRLRERLGRLIGCGAHELALTASTSDGLIALACSIPFERGDRIACFRGEFPANTTSWFQAAQAVDGQVALLEQEGLSDDVVLAGLDAALRHGGVRLVAVSAVQFSTGRAMPLDRIVRLAHAHGAEVCVDAIQALGVMPLDVRALGVDYLASGAHKWLMGLEGVGFVYVAPERVAALRPRTAGWLSHTDPLGFLLRGPGLLTYDRPIRSEVGYLEGHSLNAIGCVALEAGLELIEGLGVGAVQAHVRRYNDALEAGLVARGFTSLRTPGSPSGTLSVLPPDGQSAIDWAQAFAAGGVSMSAPDGKLRFSPHWPNHLDEVADVLAVVDAHLGGRAR